MKLMKRVLAATLAGAMTIGAMSMGVGAAENQSTSKWATENTYVESHSTEGIILDYSFSRTIDWDLSQYVYTADVTITIPEDFVIPTDGKVFINLLDGISDEWTFEPGDVLSLDYTFINNSSYDLSYIENSFDLNTGRNYQISEEDVKFTNSDFKTTGYIAGAVGFDGTNITDAQAMYRATNPALKALLSIDAYSNSASYYTDSKIEAALKNAGYDSIDNLYDYYVDYANQKYGTQNTELDQFTVSQLYNTFMGQLNTYKIEGLRETESRLAAFGYDYFYNTLFMLFDRDAHEGFLTNSECESRNYSVGAWMRNSAPAVAYEKSLSEAFASFTSGDEVNKNLTIQMSGHYTCNQYQSTKWNLGAYMEFEATTAFTVEHNYYTSTNGAAYVLDGTAKEDAVACGMGEEFNADDFIADTYENNTYKYDATVKDAVNNIVTVYDPAKNVLVLNYFRSVETPKETEVEADTEPATKPTEPETKPSKTPVVEADTETEPTTQAPTETEAPTVAPEKTPVVEADVTTGNNYTAFAFVLLGFVIVGLGGAMIMSKKRAR